LYSNIEDEIRDILRDIIAEMKRGSLPEPQDLPRYVIMMARSNSSHLQRKKKQSGIQSAAVLTEPNLDAEGRQMMQRKTELAKQTLDSLNSQQNEILTRRYLHGQTSENICKAMNLTEPEVRSCESHFRRSMRTADPKQRLQVRVASAAAI
jgi:RNA polymerase sigma factor (sigma-70 family)